MADNSSSTKRLAKNTAYLYARMLFTMFITLYTSRVILKSLGVSDFGVYNVVGGIVTFMNFLNATLSSATQRFLAYDLGEGDDRKYARTFSMLINIYVIFCIVVVFVLEIIGPIYINNYMKIDECRIPAAQWVFQFSLITFVFNTFTVPFRSSLVAHEKMNIYAYIGIYESVIGLIIAYTVSYVAFDRLIFYGFLMMIMYVSVTIYVIIYCKRKLSGCTYIRYWDNTYFKTLLSYAGWNLFGSVTGVMNLQGQAIVLNLFFGPVVNAAKAISDRVNSMISHFCTSFYMAVTPQIIKSYAAGNIDYMRSLVLSSSRYSFLLLFVISCPLFVVINPILELWLGKEQITPEMISFCRCTLVFLMVNILEQPLTMAVRATGDIRRYQIVVGSLTLTFIPLCLILFYLGSPAYTSLLLLALIYFIATFVRVRIVAPILKITQLDYLKKVLFPIFKILVISLFVIYLLLLADGWVSINWILKFGLVFIITAVISYIFGISKNEKDILKTFVLKRIKKF